MYIIAYNMFYTYCMVSSEDDEEDFSKGIQAFIKSVKQRRETRLNHDGPFSAEHVGIENRLVAAVTFEKTYWCASLLTFLAIYTFHVNCCYKKTYLHIFSKPNERVLHLTVISVRKRFRKWGIGKYLISVSLFLINSTRLKI